MRRLWVEFWKLLLAWSRTDRIRPNTRKRRLPGDTTPSASERSGSGQRVTPVRLMIEVVCRRASIEASAFRSSVDGHWQEMGSS